MIVVVDASAVVDVLIDSPKRPGLDERLRYADEALAPELLLVEVASALWRLTRAGHLTNDDASSAMARLHDFPVTLVSHALLADEAWARRQGLRMTDAYYVALAVQLGAPLLTTDLRLAGGATGISVITVS